MRRHHDSCESGSWIANEWCRSMMLQTRWASTQLPPHPPNGRRRTRFTIQVSPEEIREIRICGFDKIDGPQFQGPSSISLRRADRRQKERSS